MSDFIEETQTDAAPAADPGRRPGYKFPLAVAVLHLAALAYAVQASTIILSAIGYIVAPALAGLLLLFWWLFASRLAWRERIAGIALFAGVVAVMVIPQPDNGWNILLFALPVITFGTVAILVLTAKMPWAAGRWSLACLLLATGVVFGAQRVDGVQGNLLPLLSWRWQATSEDLFAQAIGGTSQESHGTAALPAEPGPRDWLGFRGASRDGRASGVTFAKNWDEKTPVELWRRRVGLGWSSFAAVGDYLFTQEQRINDEVVVCYHAETGDEVWVNRMGQRFEDSMGSGPRATPTYEAGRLYTQGATGILQCLDAATGEMIWRRDLRKDTNAGLPQWGFASSPLVEEDLVVVYAGAPEGKSVAAYDKVSGAPVWTSGAGTHGYSSAHPAVLEDVPQLLMISNIGIQALALRTGEILWEELWDVSTNPRCVQPLVYDGNRVLLGTAGGKGTRLLEVSHADDEWRVREAWTKKSFRPYFNDFVYHEGYCYGFDGSMLACLDAKTGELMWKDKKYGGQVLLLPDLDALLLLSEKGQLLLIEADPSACTIITEMDALSGKTWNHPVIANGKLFVRNSDEAVCYQLPA